MKNNNHQYWLNRGTWYNTAICLRLHGSMFEYFITYARYDRYNIICSLVAHYQIQPAYEDYETSMGDISIPKIATKEALKALGDTLNFIDICRKLFFDNYDAICEA